MKEQAANEVLSSLLLCSPSHFTGSSSSRQPSQKGNLVVQNRIPRNFSIQGSLILVIQQLFLQPQKLLLLLKREQQLNPILKFPRLQRRNLMIPFKSKRATVKRYIPSVKRLETTLFSTRESLILVHLLRFLKKDPLLNPNLRQPLIHKKSRTMNLPFVF